MMRDKEKYSINYLIFRQPTEYILLLIPFTIGFLATSFTIRSESLESFSNELIDLKYYELIDSYLLYSKYALTVLIAFFICYRWSAMENDGSFGFWLTLGVNRTSFFIFSHLKAIGILYLTQLFGILMIIYVNNIVLSFQVIMLLNLLVISNLLVIVTIAGLIGNVIRNPEIASLLYISVMIILILLYRNGNSFMSNIFMSDLQFKYSSGFLALVLSILFGVIFFGISLWIFKKRDMEM